MPDAQGMYESKDVLLVDGFHCLGGQIFDRSTRPVVLGLFSGTRQGKPARTDVMIPAPYVSRVANQMIDVAREVETDG